MNYRNTTTYGTGFLRGKKIRFVTGVLSIFSLIIVISACSSLNPSLKGSTSEKLPLITITNNYSFPIKEKLYFKIPVSEDPLYENYAAILVDSNFSKPSYRTLQLEREDEHTFAWLDVKLGPGESHSYTLGQNHNKMKASLEVDVLNKFPSGLPANFRLGHSIVLPLFDLSIVEIIEGLEGFSAKREERIRDALNREGKNDNLLFKEISRDKGPVISEFCFQGKGGKFNDYEILVTYRIPGSGIVDMEISIAPHKINEPKAYLALAKHIFTDKPQEAVIRWKGMPVTVAPGEASPPRTNRMDAWGRDVNWMSIGGGAGDVNNRAILARFTPNLTRIDNGRIRNANDYLVNEYLIGLDSSWVLLAEIGRENDAMNNYIPRQFIVPSEEEVVELHYRLLPPDDRDIKEIDATFNTYAGYRYVRKKERELKIDFGVEGVSFGTSYFPHSTLAENFEYWRSPGMSGRFRPVDKWWPMFKHWHFFRKEIRRDMRIANSMGLDWIRIHHFDAPDFRKDHITSPEGQWMLDYFEFIVETARETDLLIFLDFSLSPDDVALLAERFGDVIGIYEIQNEVLIIPGASKDRFSYWNEIRERILEKQPEAKILLTGGPQFYAIYDRLSKEGIKSDAVGQHAYVDRRETPTIFRDFALSLGGYASQKGLFPLNSEYNWRMITRDTEEEQANHFSEISDHLLSQKAIPLLMQFQFQETFAVPPRNRGALRHYELLRVDRTPKPQAFAYIDMIKKYGKESNHLKQLSIDIDEVNIKPGHPFNYTVRLHNLTNRKLDVSAFPRLPEGFETNGPEISFTLEPGVEKVIERTAMPSEELAPGVYHFFEELRYDNRIYFGWAFASYRSHPRLDLEAPVLNGVRYIGGLELLEKIDLSSFSHVVFGEGAPSLEVSWAFYIYQSLRSATGAGIERAEHFEIDDSERESNLILVGNTESNPLIEEIADQLPDDFQNLSSKEGMVLTLPNPFGGQGTLLLVTGSDPEGIQKAASDFIYRYWRYAKNSVTFRQGMPPAESDWVQPPQVHNNLVENIVLEGPATGSVDESIRIVVLEEAEPPGPVAGITLSIYRDDQKIAFAKTNLSGEAEFRLMSPGLYDIRVEGVKGASIQVQITE